MTEPFLPTAQCFAWAADILWLHVLSDAVIAFSYILIPTALYIIATRNQYRGQHKDLAYLFMALIFSCGLTHAAAIYTAWVPAYRLEGWLKAITASIAAVTTLVLLPKLPDLLLNAGIQRKYERMEDQQRMLEAQLAQMNSVYEASLGREERIIHLKKEINQELALQGLPPRYRIHED